MQHRSPPHFARRGFTLIEMMIVMGIILILISMLFIGFKYIGKSTQNDSTKATLESLKTMQANFEKTVTASSPEAIPTAAMLGADPNITPTAVDGNSGSYGQTSNAMIYTLAIMLRLRAVPDNRAIIENTPSNRIITSVNLASLGYSSSTYAAATQYYAGDIVVGTDSNTYVCVEDSMGNDPVTVNPYWVKTALLNNVPIFKDAWNNPILFVPAGGMLTNLNLVSSAAYAGWAPGTNYTVNSQVSYTVNGALQNFVCVQANTSVGGSPPATNAPPNSLYWKSAYSPTNYRPYWLSAGPDGNFQASDDNVTSFGN